MARFAKLLVIRLMPWVTRYFHVGDIGVDRLAIGRATLIRKRWRCYSYLYLAGDRDKMEPVQDTPFFWSPWVKGSLRMVIAPMKREVDELEAFVLIRRAAHAQMAGSAH